MNFKQLDQPDVNITLSFGILHYSFYRFFRAAYYLYGFSLFPSHEAWWIPSEACEIITIIKHWRLMPMILLKPNAFLYSLLCLTLSKALNAIEQCVRCFDKLFINLTPHQPAHFCFSDVSMKKFWTLFFPGFQKRCSGGVIFNIHAFVLLLDFGCLVCHWMSFLLEVHGFGLQKSVSDIANDVCVSLLLQKSLQLGWGYCWLFFISYFSCACWHLD